MKNLIYLFFLTLLCFSCSDPCDDVNCGPGTCIDGTCECPDGFSGANCEIEDLCFNSMCGNGTCNPDSGLCDCDEGYEGSNCESKIIDRYTGSWLSNDFTCANDLIGPITFVFEEGETVTDLQFYDIDDPDIKYQVLYNDDQLTTPLQTVDGVEVSGNGTIDDDTNTMILNFTIEDDGEVFNCTGLFTRQ